MRSPYFFNETLDEVTMCTTEYKSSKEQYIGSRRHEFDPFTKHGQVEVNLVFELDKGHTQFSSQTRTMYLILEIVLMWIEGDSEQNWA